MLQLSETRGRKSMFTIREASEMTGVKVRTIRSWIAKGNIMCMRFPNSHKIAIPGTEIDKMINRKTPNFCMSVVDGEGTAFKKKTKSFKLAISQREGNGSVNAFDVSCHENKEMLITTIRDADGDIVAEFVTEKRR